jgi:hypothetical protein
VGVDHYVEFRNQNDLDTALVYGRRVAQLLNYGESKVRMLIITSQLRSIKDGRSHRILPEWVEAYVLRFGSDPSRRPDASCARRVHAVCVRGCLTSVSLLGAARGKKFWGRVRATQPSPRNTLDRRRAEIHSFEPHVRTQSFQAWRMIGPYCARHSQHSMTFLPSRVR